MTNTRARARSRMVALLMVAAAHFVVLDIMWRAHSAAPEESAGFVTTIFFLSEFPRTSQSSGQPQLIKSQGAGTAISPRSSRQSEKRALAPQARLTPPDDSSASAASSIPGKDIDWSGQIAGVADAVMVEEEAAQRQRSALMRKFVLAADPSEATARMPTRFRWSNIDADHDGTRNWMSTLHLNEHCVLVGFVIPDCAIERMKQPASYLEWLEQKHDATLVTAGPNSVPP